MRLLVILCASLVACSQPDDASQKPPSPAPPAAEAGPPSAAPTAALTLEGLAKPGVDKRWIRGAAVAVIRPGTAPEFAFVGDSGTARPIDGKTRFAIGSITKVFTSLLLADASLRGELDLDDSVTKLTKIRLPTHKGKAISFRHLSKHTSGLPRLPPLKSTDYSQPYAGYQLGDFLAYLPTIKLTRSPGDSSEYSNLGATVLGIALAKRAGTDYPALVRERALKPLGLSATSVGPDPKAAALWAAGSNGMLDTTPNWKLGIFAPAGALWSSLEDIAAFAQANLAPAGALAKTIELTQKELLAWQRRPDGVLWHNGGTAGFHSFMAIDRKHGVAVVVLSNTASQTTDAFGFGVLEWAQTGKTEYRWPDP